MSLYIFTDRIAYYITDNISDAKNLKKVVLSSSLQEKEFNYLGECKNLMYSVSCHYEIKNDKEINCKSEFRCIAFNINNINYPIVNATLKEKQLENINMLWCLKSNPNDYEFITRIFENLSLDNNLYYRIKYITKIPAIKQILYDFTYGINDYNYIIVKRKIIKILEKQYYKYMINKQNTMKKMLKMIKEGVNNEKNKRNNNAFNVF